METFDALTQFYNNYDEEGRLLSRHGSVEFLTTMRYIEKYLHEGMRILEIGAATGRYSHTLARMGYRVDAVELVQHNIDLLRKTQSPVKTSPSGRVMPVICPVLIMIPLIWRWSSAPCTTCLPSMISFRHWLRPSV